MKQLVKACLITFGLMMPVTPLAQHDRLRLICRLKDATLVPPPKNQIHFVVQALCIVLVSLPDTVVKAIGAGRITNVEYTEESGNGVVLFSRINGKEYYFWYTGMNKVLVRRNDAVKVGQPIGYVSPGERIELTMYE